MVTHARSMAIRFIVTLDILIHILDTEHQVITSTIDKNSSRSCFFFI
ncbi:MAG: hypothetical protein K0Q87_3301, partial [Neobacillus sp.]|nr:hypothetical protein [Neobacillus sp.]